MKKNKFNFKLNNKVLIGLVVFAVLVVSFVSVAAFTGGFSVNIEECSNCSFGGGEIQGAGNLGAYGDTNVTNLVASGDVTVSDDVIVTDDVIITGEITFKEKSTNLAATSIYTTTTLTIANSGTTYYLSASGTTITLPAVATVGTNFRFVINGASTDGNFIVDSAEGDNMEGTLIVAGAVVDCDAVDQINFVTDGENLGDYVEVRSDGTQWLIGDSGVLTAAKLTCTDPS